MNAVLITLACLVASQADVQADAESKTQLYVKTTPPGATVSLDGCVLGKSDGLFDVAAGAHKLVLQLEGYAADERSIEARQRQITRVEALLRKPSGQQVELGYVDDSAEGQRSLADSGHAVAFQRPAGMRSIVAVKLFAARYGRAEPPNEDFHVYLLDQDRKVLEHFAVAYRNVERGELRWHSFAFPAVAVPEKFFVALWFNAEPTKGVYLGLDTGVKQSHSYVGLPDKGFQKVDQCYDWMVRAVLAPEDGKKPTYPKVTTYEEEKAADTESQPALPSRTWSDSTGAFSVEAQLVGVEDGKVRLKKADGRTVAVPLDRLCQEDQAFVARHAGAGQERAKSGQGGTRELSHDDGAMAGKSSIAGGGHAVRFAVDGESWQVTSVSLHGSRYGMPRPPAENFDVWICDEHFKPIATFHFPYSSYTRSAPVWKSFRIRPTPVPPKFVVCFGFNPQQTKGVFVSYDGHESENSLVGIPGQGEPRPFAKGNWLIRCKVENRPEAGKRGE
jgi:RNA polymerase sigma-70 factor (ECF subfamily)